MDDFEIVRVHPSSSDPRLFSSTWSLSPLPPEQSVEQPMFLAFIQKIIRNGFFSPSKKNCTSPPRGTCSRTARAARRMSKLFIVLPGFFLPSPGKDNGMILRWLMMAASSIYIGATVLQIAPVVALKKLLTLTHDGTDKISAHIQNAAMRVCWCARPPKPIVFSVSVCAT